MPKRSITWIFVIVALFALTQSTTARKFHKKGSFRSPHVSFTDRCECGRKMSSPRPEGGGGKGYAYPWMAALVTPDGQKFCGGALINDLFLLTAAHCFRGRNASTVTVLLKQHDANEAMLVRRSVAHAHLHHEYDPSTQQHDIALLRMNLPVEVGVSGLVPVCLPPRATMTYAGELATVSGWKDDTHQEETALNPVPSEVGVPVLTYTSCKYHTKYRSESIFDEMLCAGDEGVDSCLGLSGGPLVFRNRRGAYQQIGIMSFGVSCAKEGYPTVYTRVTEYLDWIEFYARRGEYCNGAAFPSLKEGFRRRRTINLQ